MHWCIIYIYLSVGKITSHVLLLTFVRPTARPMEKVPLVPYLHSFIGTCICWLDILDVRQPPTTQQQQPNNESETSPLSLRTAIERKDRTKNPPA
jgi:hypothetical protein